MTADILQLLVAGLALVWQTSQTINFAQGEFVMLPAFFVLIAMNLGVPLYAAILIAIGVSVVVLGLLFKHLVVDPMIRHGVLPLVISTIALALLLKEGVKEFYGAEAQSFPPLAADIKVTIAGASISVQSLIVIVV